MILKDECTWTHDAPCGVMAMLWSTICHVVRITKSEVHVKFVIGIE